MKIQRKNKVLRGSTLHKTIKGQGRTKDYRTDDSSVRNAVKNVKKILEEKRSRTAPVPKKVEQTSKIKPKRSWKSRTSSRGIVYLGHIPHGFYEEQMQEYFKQFGNVIRVRVARSKNTGKSRGYGYIEFLHKDVAKVAAETMNNYLMCGRLLKATYVPVEKQHNRFFAGRNWTEKEYPKLTNRDRSVLEKNARIEGKTYAVFRNNTKRKLLALEKKLEESGIDIKFQPAHDRET